MSPLVIRLCPRVLALVILLAAPLARADAPAMPTLAPMLARVSPGVVNISVQGRIRVQQNPLFQDPFFRQFFNIPEQPQFEKIQAVGSGVIFDAAHGYVLTNNHVIEHANRIVVTLKDRRQFTAKLVGTDPQTDVAVLKIEPDNLTAVPLGDSSKLRVGDNVGIGFAIPIDMAKEVADQLIAHGKVRRGRLGVMIQDLTPALASAMGIKAAGGAIVSRVYHDSPAAKAGIEAGDVITALDGKPLRDSAELRNELGLMEPGTSVTLTIERKGETRMVTAQLEPAAKAKQETEAEQAPGGSPLAGAELGRIPADNPLHGKVKGVYVAQVAPGSPADDAGLQPGDIIVSVDQERVATAEQIARIVRSHKGKPLLLNIRRGDEALFITIG